MSTYIEGH